MYQVFVEKYFDAAHFLRGYRGKCEAVHGHRYKVVVRVESPNTDDIGLAYDFTDLKGKLADILERYDHVCLNDIPPFDNTNPSSENIAAAIYYELESKLAGEQVSLVEVEVWETPHQGIVYRPD